MENKLQTLLKSRKFVYLDGGMGTMIQQNGLKLGQRPELFVLEHPEAVAKIHRQYLESGADVLYTCTFGANAHKLAGTGVSPAQVIKAAVSAAQKAAEGFPGPKPLIALDIGPIGELLEPAGTLSFREAYSLFREMATAGEEAGADLAVFETIADLGEMRAAVLAAKENTSLPVLATMTFEADGRTFTGCTAEAAARTLDGLGVDALGLNCSLGPGEILPIARRMAKCTAKPLAVKPNAGLPDPQDNCYHLSPADFAAQMREFAPLGIRLAGGCCGTTPEFIRELKKALEPLPCPSEREILPAAVCSPLKTVELNGVHIIGERINPTGKKRFQQALLEQDLDYILAQGVAQADAGAEILDVNVGHPGVDEPALMEKVVRELQGVLELPLQIDSSDPAAIEAGLRAFHGVAIVNSVNGEEENLRKILPLVKKYGAFVVGLTLDSRGIPQTAEERLAIARKILESALSYGIPKEKVLMDCLTLTVSAQQSQAAETLKAVQMEFPTSPSACPTGNF